MSRWKASGIYLAVSACVAGVVLAFMLLVWFPWPLFQISGGNRLLFILVGVDVVLGPLLVLIVYKHGKKTLKFDLAVIVSLQVAALAYGIHTLYLARPVYMVFTIDRFDVVTAKDLDPEDLAQSQAAFNSVPSGRPRYVAVERPADSAAQNKVLESALAGKDLQMFPQYYVPYTSKAQDALNRAQPVAVIRQRAPREIDGYLKSSGRTPESIKFLPLRAPKADAAVLIDAITGNPLKIVVVDPW
jgi:hypothetical protein